MADTEVFVGLRLLGELEPETITNRLGIRPSREFVKDQQVGTGRSGRAYEHSGWVVDSDGTVEADTIEPHLAWLLDLIEPRADELASILASGVFGSIDCHWASPGASGGPWISPKSMTRMGALELPLIISFYAAESDRPGDTTNESEAPSCLTGGAFVGCPENARRSAAARVRERRDPATSRRCCTSAAQSVQPTGANAVGSDR